MECVEFPSSGELPDPGIEPRSSALQADSLPSESPERGNQKARQLIFYDSYEYVPILMFH